MEPKIFTDQQGKMHFNTNMVKPGHAVVIFDTPVQPSSEQKMKLQNAINDYIAVYDADDDAMYSALDRMESEFAATVADIRSRM
jgi:hypothetical protein